ncbi:MAG: hypothetical protein QOC83_1204 [Pseudonocardiales bacterium]|jgi:hypothetical protein|uniref:hypothetical protein n=1 Tax=Pseudonocardia sp. Cha107L01 TaxID=3457576 RepID=UPI0028CA0CA5|nr:hypothetical protein [Pseudonocardiales bacterium]MDT7692562.1 hypothetical protein [Pseudonocardiales bacterium]
MTGAVPTMPPEAASSLVGSVGGLVVMGVGALLVVAVVLVANLWMRWQRIKASRPRFEPNTVEATPAYRRYLVAAAWAGGSTRNWDHSVRPVLAELVELALAERLPAGGDPRASAKELLGPELWALIDRDVQRSEDRSTPGAGREALLRILERVERQ